MYAVCHSRSSTLYQADNFLFIIFLIHFFLFFLFPFGFFLSHFSAGNMVIWPPIVLAKLASGRSD